MQRHGAAAGLAAGRAWVDARDLDDLLQIRRRFVSPAVEGTVRDWGGLARLVGERACAPWAALLASVGGGKSARRDRDRGAMLAFFAMSRAGVFAWGRAIQYYEHAGQALHSGQVDEFAG
jgi:hypothetical protein